MNPYSGPVVTNPLLPGKSATQTRAGVGQLGARAPPYNGYSMPGEASSPAAQPAGAFTSLMEAAYMMDVLVGDHFEQFARAPQGQRNGQKMLDAAAFGRAADALGIHWAPRDSANVFRWIY